MLLLLALLRLVDRLWPLPAPTAREARGSGTIGEGSPRHPATPLPRTCGEGTPGGSARGSGLGSATWGCMPATVRRRATPACQPCPGGGLYIGRRIGVRSPGRAALPRADPAGAAVRAAPLRPSIGPRRAGGGLARGDEQKARQSQAKPGLSAFSQPGTWMWASGSASGRQPASSRGQARVGPRGASRARPSPSCSRPRPRLPPSASGAPRTPEPSRRPRPPCSACCWAIPSHPPVQLSAAVLLF